MRVNATVKWTFLVVTVPILSACNSNTSLFRTGPSDVVKTLYASCNAGDYSKAESTLSSDSQRLLHGDLGAMAGGVKGVCDKMSRNGTIASVEVTNEVIRGQGADVTSTLHFKDGSSTSDHEPMVREGGNWKIAPGE